MPLSNRALIVLLAAVTAAGPIALNIYLPVLPMVRAEFGVTVAAASSTVTAPLVAFAVGILLFGPLSDRVGRRPVILAGLGVYLAGSALALFAPSVEWLTTGRVVQAAGTSAGLTVARAVMGDLFERETMARMIAYLTMAMVIANALAPALGGALAEFVDWRTVFAILLAAGAATALATWRWLPETRPPDGASTAAQVLRVAATLAARPMFLGFVLQSGVVYATFLVFVSLMPYVWVHGLGRSTSSYGLWYLWIAVGYFAGNWHVTRYGARLGVHRMVVLGVRLQAASAVVAWAVAAAGWWHPAWIFVPWAVLAYGQGLALPNVTASAVSLAPGHAGAASGLLGFGQQILGAVAIQALALSSTATPLPVATFVAAASVFAVLWLPLMGRR